MSDPNEKYPEGVEIKYILLYHVLYEKNVKEQAEIHELCEPFPSGHLLDSRFNWIIGISAFQSSSRKA